MNLSTATLQPGAITSGVLLFGSPCAITEHPRPERLRPYQAQDTKRTGSPAGAANAAGATPRADASLGRVLVVDDEALVRRSLALFLTKAGFTVTAVESAEAALELLRAGEAFDLLVTDQSMPGMTGRELVGEATRLRPGLPALVVTGYDIAGGLEQLPEAVPILRKPVDREAFVRHVQVLIGAGESKHDSSE
jgi:CheY-like chemotaxis protein